jgi:hypothetical protein
MKPVIPDVLEVALQSDRSTYINNYVLIGGSFGKFVDWRQCAALMQREAVTVMQSFSGGGSVVVT